MATDSRPTMDWWSRAESLRIGGADIDLNYPIVGFAATPTTVGITWLLPTAESSASETPGSGSMGGMALNKPIVGRP
jgi:hypothetical protein